VVLYEMLTGTRAFDGETKTAILAAILKDQPAPIQQLQPMVPRALDRVVRKCLEKKPADRWHSAHDLKQTLELIDLAGLTSASQSVSSNSGIQPAPPIYLPRVGHPRNLRPAIQARCACRGGSEVAGLERRRSPAPVAAGWQAIVLLQQWSSNGCGYRCRQGI
jgi:serine/threonine protein kinase